MVQISAEEKATNTEYVRRKVDEACDAANVRKCAKICNKLAGELLPDDNGDGLIDQEELRRLLCKALHVVVRKGGARGKEKIVPFYETLLEVSDKVKQPVSKSWSSLCIAAGEGDDESNSSGGGGSSASSCVSASVSPSPRNNDEDGRNDDRPVIVDEDDEEFGNIAAQISLTTDKSMGRKKRGPDAFEEAEDWHYLPQCPVAGCGMTYGKWKLYQPEGKTPSGEAKLHYIDAFLWSHEFGWGKNVANMKRHFAKNTKDNRDAEAAAVQWLKEGHRYDCCGRSRTTEELFNERTRNRKIPQKLTSTNATAVTKRKKVKKTVSKGPIVIS